MEAVEFYLWDGSVRYRLNGEERTLTEKDREIVEFVLAQLRRFFPDAYQALSEEFTLSERNKWWYDFKRVEMFIRCNFSEHDTLSFDIQDGMLHFEDVKCPLKGVCRHEGIVCKPKFKVPVSKEESRAAALYSKGLTANEIAKVLGKGVKTVKNQLGSAAKHLGLSRTRDLIKIFSVYNITLWE